MEAPRASLDALWFTNQRPRFHEADEDGGSESDDDENDAHASDRRAEAVQHASLCIAACSSMLSVSASPMPPAVEIRTIMRNCIELWRTRFKVWQSPCGNHLNVPDLLFVCACHLRVLLMPVEEQRYAGRVSDVAHLGAYLEVALKEWDRAPSLLHTEQRMTVDACARAIVFWGSNVTPADRLLDTTLSPEDVSLLTMNVNVHQNLDNRARNTDLAPVAAAAASSANMATSSTATAAAVLKHDDDEQVLAKFVRLASRYAFFASLHNAAQHPSPDPRLQLHQQIAAEAVRPCAKLIETNVGRLYSMFRERSRVTVPELVQRDLNYTIWKRLISVGSMEVTHTARRVFILCTGVPSHGADNRMAQVEPGDRLNSRTDCGNRARSTCTRCCHC